MRKIGLIIRREYLTRVRKRSFWLTTLLTPLLISALYAIPAFLFLSGNEVKNISVVDESGLFAGKFKNEKEYRYAFSGLSPEAAKAELGKKDLAAVVVIPKDIVEKPDGLKMFSKKTVNMGVQRQVEGIVQNEVRNERLRRAGINVQVIEDNRVQVNAQTFSTAEGRETTSHFGLSMGIGYVIALLLYMTVFISGSQVMNGVVEEKSSRIIEVIISSVRPMELMMGKIIGVGLVGLTQFVLWAALTATISMTASGLMASRFKLVAKQTEMTRQAAGASADQQLNPPVAANPVLGVMEGLKAMPWGQMLALFVFYYIGGYLFYSSLFAAVGSAVESPQEAQQLMFPVTIPLIISIMLISYVISEPDSRVAFWASVIPFTSPVNMMARLPFGVPTWEILLSMALLVAGFVLTTWLAARIYRVGILMYGKKVSFRELGRWLFYR